MYRFPVDSASLRTRPSGGFDFKYLKFLPSME